MKNNSYFYVTSQTIVCNREPFGIKKVIIKPKRNHIRANAS